MKEYRTTLISIKRLNYLYENLYVLASWEEFWSNYNDLTRPGPQKVAEKGKSPRKQGTLGWSNIMWLARKFFFGLVQIRNLRFAVWMSIGMFNLFVLRGEGGKL